MTRAFFHTQLRWLILVVLVLILAMDARAYYQRQPATQPTVKIIDISPAASPSPPPSSAPSEVTPALNSRITAFHQLATLDAAQIEAAQRSFTGAALPTSVTQVAVYQLDYEIKGRDDSWQPVAAKVYIPLDPGQHPLFVFGSGTTGMADKCAPSLENIAIENLGNYHNHMISQAAAGYVAVFPDYEGFHSADATQAYFIVESEAKTMIGAIHSLLELQPSTLALRDANLQQVFLAGYSQGGHAALSAAQQWQELPSSVQLKGIIQYAGAADVEALFLESPWLASYLVESYVEYYGSRLSSSDVLQDRWLQEMKRNNQILCVNAANAYYPHEPSAVYTPAFLDAVESQTWPEALAAWKEVITLNTPETDLPDVPYLSIQGEVDPIVTARTQQSNVAILCQQNKNVMYRAYSGVDHYRIRKVSFSFTNEWMSSVLAGQTPASTCSQS
jgi:predicted esterase